MYPFSLNIAGLPKNTMPLTTKSYDTLNPPPPSPGNLEKPLQNFQFQSIFLLNVS